MSKALLFTTLGLGLALAAPHAMAQQGPTTPATGWRGGIGAAVVSIPTYEGSPNRGYGLIPSFDIAYRTRRLGSVTLGGAGLAWHFLEADDYHMGVYLGADGGRKATKAQHSGLISLEGDARLNGMGDIKPTAEAGIIAGAGPASVQVHTALGASGDHRTLVDLGFMAPLPLTGKLSLSAGPTFTWANRNYMQAYFGVTPAQAAASRFAPFSAQAGWRKLEFTVGAEYALTKRWKLTADVGVRRLLGDAARSPLAERETSLIGLFGANYGF